MEFPTNLRYTKDHEWIRIEDGTGVVGITDYAQGELGDVVFVELPAIRVDQPSRCNKIPGDGRKIIFMWGQIRICPCRRNFNALLP